MMPNQIILDRGTILGILMTLGLDIHAAIEWLQVPSEILLGWTPMELIEMGRTEEVLVYIGGAINELKKYKDDLGAEEEEEEEQEQ